MAQSVKVFHTEFETSSQLKYTFLKVNYRSARKRCEICDKNTKFWSLYCWLWTSFIYFSSVSIVYFEQVNVSWVNANPTVFFILCIANALRTFLFIMHTLTNIKETNGNDMSQCCVKYVTMCVFTDPYFPLQGQNLRYCPHTGK